ncbi:hypothetical protein ACQ86K_01925 [Mucilaginibacter sp. P19]|uniref:hypothetical protein n=1 Tax=Mucilaginibacter sp. P19 TaxID=3423947 RepID=UPI003D670E91
MKLLVVTCLKECLGDISKIFKEANIDVFSTSEIIGQKQGKGTNFWKIGLPAAMKKLSQ